MIQIGKQTYIPSLRSKVARVRDITSALDEIYQVTMNLEMAFARMYNPAVAFDKYGKLKNDCLSAIKQDCLYQILAVKEQAQLTIGWYADYATLEVEAMNDSLYNILLDKIINFRSVFTPAASGKEGVIAIISRFVFYENITYYMDGFEEHATDLTHEMIQEIATECFDGFRIAELLLEYINEQR